jgi:hypothetical protein
MGLFSKEAACDGCRISFEKETLHRFDPAWARYRKTQDRRRRLCTPCLSAALREYLVAFPFRAAVVGPDPARNAYVFGPLDRSRSHFWNWGEDDLQEQVRALLPVAGAGCARCGGAASYNWCGPEAFIENEYGMWVSDRGAFPEENRCGTCIATAIDESFRTPGLVLATVSPPADTDGLLISQDV